MSSRSSTPSVQNLTRVTRGGHVLESHRVAHLRAQRDAHLVRDARRDGHRGDAAGLSARHQPPARGPTRLDEVLRHLRGLAASRLPHQHGRRTRLHEVQDGVAGLKDGEALPLGLQREILVAIEDHQPPPRVPGPFAINLGAQRERRLGFLRSGLPERHPRYTQAVPSTPPAPSTDDDEI